jgi:signal transduction histidine kinase
MQPKTYKEDERLKALWGYGILDTPPEKDFDCITRIASEICKVPISLISLVDEGRTWHKSRQGVDLAEAPREHSFCSVAIQSPGSHLVVNDLREDGRFAANPFVAGEPHVAFYAGAPLVNPEGHVLGTLCVFDFRPRQLSPAQLETMGDLAAQVMAQLELRRKVAHLKAAQERLKLLNSDLEGFAHVVAHDLKSPLRAICSYAGLVRRRCSDRLTPDEAGMLGTVQDSASKLSVLVDGILGFTKACEGSVSPHEQVDLGKLVRETIGLLPVSPGFVFKHSADLPTIATSRSGLQQVLLNLLGNAVKYNDKKEGWARIDFWREQYRYRFMVSDNGPGIPPEEHGSIFQLMRTLGKRDRGGEVGMGIGLATVKKIVEKLGGAVRVKSEPGKGTEFEFYVAAGEEEPAKNHGDGPNPVPHSSCADSGLSGVLPPCTEDRNPHNVPPTRL